MRSMVTYSTSCCTCTERLNYAEIENGFGFLVFSISEILACSVDPARCSPPHTPRSDTALTALTVRTPQEPQQSDTHTHTHTHTVTSSHTALSLHCHCTGCSLAPLSRSVLCTSHLAAMPSSTVTMPATTTTSAAPAGPAGLMHIQCTVAALAAHSPLPTRSHSSLVAPRSLALHLCLLSCPHSQLPLLHEGATACSPIRAQQGGC